MSKILVVEDDTELCDLLKRTLSVERYVVETVHTADDAWAYLRQTTYDLVVLDIGLPDFSGIDVCKRFREIGGHTPILMLTGRKNITEKVEGFEAGADDYLTKPFEAEELVARVRALLRRPSMLASKILKVAEFALDTEAHKLTKDGVEIQLTKKEFSLLEFFMRNPNQVFSAEALLQRIWSSDAETSPATVRTFLKQLRKKLGETEESSIIRNIHGVGYRLESQ